VARSLPTRAEVDRRFTWAAETVFPEESGWDEAVETILASLPDLR